MLNSTGLYQSPNLPEGPWTCRGCKTLIYHKDADGRPVAGTPQSFWWSTDYPRICSLCYQLGLLGINITGPTTS